MRYLEVVARHAVALRDGETPVPGPGQGLVEVDYRGLCRSDLGAVAGFAGGSPRRLGHEVSGRVVAGNGVGLAPGTPVATLVDDGYATAVVAAPSQIAAIPAGVSARDACLAEPLACALLAVDRLAGTSGAAALVGAGFMGLLVLDLLVKRGSAVTVLEPRANARTLAASLGAAEVRTPEDRADLMERFELVMECAGSQPALDAASELVGIGGRLGVVGFHQSHGGRRQIDLRSWNYKGIEVINAHERSQERIMDAIARALAQMAEGYVTPGALVTDTVELSALPGLLADSAWPPADSIKAVVRCTTS